MARLIDGIVIGVAWIVLFGILVFGLNAIGGSNADIYSILTKQASIAAIAGYVVGAGMAYGLRPAMAKADSPSSFFASPPGVGGLISHSVTGVGAC